MKSKKILGLILELNPPHNGHHYFIQKAKELINPDITIAVISTNFSMRGDICVLDKFTKTKIATEMGIDLVLELPTAATICSADYFAYNAVNILNQFNVTDIVFGSEAENIDILNKLQNIINTNEYNIIIKEYLDKGFSYSTSCNKVLSDLNCSNDLISNFSLPNNTLGIQYINAIKKINNSINYNIIKRISNNYYDTNTTGSISSATSIRNLIKDNKDTSEFIFLGNQTTNFIDIKKSYYNLFNILKYKILLSNPIDLKNILGVEEGIENRLINIIKDSENYEEFINKVITKRYTINKIKRILLNIILGIKEKNNLCYNYIRILGFNEKGKKFINTLDKETKKSIITSFKDITEENIIALTELHSTILYSIITENKELYLKEFNIPIRSDKNDN